MSKSDDILWRADAAMMGWRMPSAPLWKRVWGIRHLRRTYHAYHVTRHELLHSGRGATRSGYDQWVLYGIGRGFERPQE